MTSLSHLSVWSPHIIFTLTTSRWSLVTEFEWGNSPGARLQTKPATERHVRPVVGHLYCDAAHGNPSDCGV